MATWSQIFRALALKLAKIQRWKEKGVIFQFSFKNPGIAKKALVKNIFFFILELTFCNYLSFSIEKSRVFLKKTWWQISSSVNVQYTMMNINALQPAYYLKLHSTRNCIFEICIANCTWSYLAC